MFSDITCKGIPLTNTQILFRELFVKCQIKAGNSWKFSFSMGFITIANGQLSLSKCTFVGRGMCNSDLLTKAVLNSDLKSANINKCSTSNFCKEKTIPLQKKELISETKLHFFLRRNSTARS